jgi:hypothetical protein
MDGRVMTIPAAVTLPLLVGYVGAYYASTETVQIRVEDKTTGWQQTQEPGTPRVQFLVYTDRGVFQVGIEPLFLEFSSAERYHALKRGGSYRVLIAGWRVPLTNWYPSIVRILD